MIKLTESEKKELEKLWFIFGNNGQKHTQENHKFIQSLLQGKNHRKFYNPTRECVEAVSEIIDLEKETNERTN